MKVVVEGGAGLRGTLRVPADKSITHRALMLGSMARGVSTIRAWSPGEDNESTARAMAALGTRIEPSGDGTERIWRVEGEGPEAWRSPEGSIDCGNSGTTMRLLAGILTGAGVPATLEGDASLQRRPMGRICRPLRALGGAIEGQSADGRELPPLSITEGAFAGGTHVSEVASAQVKSALLLAGVCAGKGVQVSEPGHSRDHTERMLQAMGAPVRASVRSSGSSVELGAGARLGPRDLQVPGDFSAAAFWIAAGLLIPDSRIALEEVGLNPTRTGLLEVLEEYGAPIRVESWQERDGEPIGTLVVEGAQSLQALRDGGHPTRVRGSLVAAMIDELVVLSAIAAAAQGPTVVADARELRVKESDRVQETVRLLGAFGVSAEEHEDGYRIEGPQPLQAAEVDVSSDHRIALTGAILALAAPGTTVLHGFEVAAVSYPSFLADAERLGARIRQEG